MSTITVARKNGFVAIACDTLSKQGPIKNSAAYVVNNSKIVLVNGNYLGITGATSAKLVLEHYFTNEDPEPEMNSAAEIFETWRKLHASLKENYFLRPEEDDYDSYESSRMDVLIANARGIFGVASHRSVQEFSRFFSVGSGTDYALGAMFALYDDPALSAEDIARRGIEAAAEFNDATGLPLISYAIALEATTG